LFQDYTPGHDRLAVAKFPSPEFGTKCQREVPSFLVTQLGIGRRKLPCQKPLRYVQPLRCGMQSAKFFSVGERTTDSYCVLRELSTAFCFRCNIDWKPGKDMTKIPQNDGSAGYKDSFFNFFAKNASKSSHMINY